MKKKYCIGWLLTGAAAMFLITHSAAAAADKVVVIPLESGNGDTGGVRTVTSVGQVWMDRNLAAHRTATKSDDSQAYGSLYQWGRLGDGHEYRESPTTIILSPDDVPGHGHFITADSGSNYDWRFPKEDNLWQGESGINNPCPAGFRLPMATEWETERASWGGSNYVEGAFASPLKLVVAGYRFYLDGSQGGEGSYGHYWSSTVKNNGARRLVFSSSIASVTGAYRAYGLSVRCIED